LRGSGDGKESEKECDRLAHARDILSSRALQLWMPLLLSSATQHMRGSLDHVAVVGAAALTGTGGVAASQQRYALHDR
jgi:hypothetical protein